MVSTPQPARPRLRRSGAPAVAGVAAGIGEHLGVPAAAVRVGFVLLSFVNGYGVLAYLALWAVVPQADRAAGAPAARDDRLGALAAALVVVAAAWWMFRAAPGVEPTLLWPLLAASGGLVIAWRQADAAQRARWRVAGRGGFGRPVVVVAWLLGATLAVVGIGGVLSATGVAHGVAGPFVVAAAALAGSALVSGPWWWRLAADFRRERRQRIRSEERAEVAAHLHDSVLQTLTLIQRHVDSPREVARLARRQERELRAWLYGGVGAVESTLASALRQSAAEVEDTHGVRVEVVVVGGDRPLDERVRALAQAAREAMVNAAKHGGVGEVSVYVELSPDEGQVYVRDRGKGFDPAAVAPDRHGLAESVIGRMERYGGRAVVRSLPGEGTEVALGLPW